MHLGCWGMFNIETKCMEYAQSQPELKENFYTHKEHITAVQEPEING